LNRKVAVLADSVACLNHDQVQEYSIGIVPLRFSSGDKTYRDSVDISTTEAYELFLEDPDAFKTSAPSPVDFLNGFREAGKLADTVLYVSLSSKLSTTYDSARIASTYAATEIPSIKIEILDSGTAAAAEGFVVLSAARAAALGENSCAVRQAAESVRDRVGALVVLDTVKHVYRSGRVPRIASLAGSMLNIKPLFSLTDKINLLGLDWNRERGIEQIIEKTKAQFGNKPLHIAVMHAYAPDAAQELKMRVQKEFTCTELFVSEFSPLMGYACGTGTLGLAFYPD